MKIIYLSSEAAPFIKTGGLGDVMQALPTKMAELGNDVTVILPKYDIIKLKYLEKIEFVDSIEYNGEIYNLVKYPDEKIKYYFIENRTLYERGHIYGDLDEDVQYAMFCEIVLKFIRKLEIRSDIIHCNDWQTGPFAYFLKTRYKHDPFFWDTRVVYTLHNLMYQGKFNDYSFKKIGYDINRYSLNFMEIGIEYSDIVNTVSPTYAEEIKYPYFSEGLEFLTNNKQIYGILNGIDYETFDPKTTQNIFKYNNNLKEFKVKNKEKLLEKFEFCNKNDDMIISLVSRLVEGKGLDLLVSKIEEILKNDAVKIIILGSGNRHYEDYFNYLAYKYKDKFKVYIGYSEELANLIYAGSDLFLMPSRYEPCGLSQMLSMRYGTIPLVRLTGGLKDTVIPYNIITGEGNGFAFESFNADDMLYTIRYAQRIYYDHRQNWDYLVEKNFNIDNSWNKSALEYIKLYEKAQKTP